MGPAHLAQGQEQKAFQGWGAGGVWLMELNFLALTPFGSQAPSQGHSFICL